LSYSKIDALLISTVIGWPNASRRGQQSLHLASSGQVGLHRLRLPTHRADLGHGRLGRLALPA
jgi:hypothetical protein